MPDKILIDLNIKTKYKLLWTLIKSRLFRKQTLAALIYE
jgi:hypothetical protein